MNPAAIALAAAVALGLAAPAAAQSLPPEIQGSWDVSVEACRAPGTSMTQVDISADVIDTFGGDAAVREVERFGDVTFVAADYQQLEGVEEVAPRERAFFRLTQRGGPDRLSFRWKDVRTDDLVRCGAGPRAARTAAGASGDPLGIPVGLWVRAGTPCEAPANAAWMVYDGQGLRGAASTNCRIGAVLTSGARTEFEQVCTASYDGAEETVRGALERQAPRRFGLLEAGEPMQDFNWCGPRLQP